MSQARRTGRLSRRAPSSDHEVVGPPSKQSRSPRPRFSNLTKTTISAAVLSGNPLPAWLIGAVHLSLPRPPLLLLLLPFRLRLLLPWLISGVVMCRVLSLHVPVCLSVRLSFLLPSFSLPFLVSLSPLPLFPCISSTARVAARHSYRLHLALLIRNPSTMRVHHDSFHVISPPPL